MKKIIISLLTASSMMLVSCGGDNGDNTNSQQGKGGVYYGGIFKMNENEDFRDLNPLNIVDVISHRIVTQVYEGLVKLDQSNLKIVPCLAEKVDVSSDATVWTFTIRKGVMFHDDPCFPEGKGRELKASDVKYCFDRLCESSPSNQLYYSTFKDKVKGANEYFESTNAKKPIAGGVSGVKVIDDYKVEITLNYPNSGFDNILVMSGCLIYPKEAVDKYGDDIRVHAVGTGPFVVNKIKEGEVVLLDKNKNYWGVDEFGNKLPYLDGIKFSFIKEKKQELLEFRKGNLHLVYRLPTEMIGEILAEFGKAKEGNRSFELQNVPAMQSYYFGMLNPVEPFNNEKVRMAFNYAIDREKIVNYTLKGDGIPAFYGIVPPIDAFKEKGFDFEKIKGYKFDPDMAKKLFAEAGFGPGKKQFPKIKLQINSGGGDRNVLTAQVIQSMLKENLGVEVVIDQMPFAQHLDNVETGKTLLWRAGWVADYPDPSSFLDLFNSKLIPEKMSDRSVYNQFRYSNPRFDSLLNLAKREVDEKKRFELYMLADQEMIAHAPIIPLLYDENYRLLQTNVKNFPANAMEYRDMSTVYFIPEKTDETAKK